MFISINGGAYVYKRKNTGCSIIIICEERIRWDKRRADRGSRWDVDVNEGIVGLYYIDDFDGTYVLDLKPYMPSVDRIDNPEVPDWCRHWPKSYEEGADFDWEAEFNF